MRKILLLLLALFIINSVSAATISGNIYSWDLQKLENVKVTINTVPEQIFVSKDSAYTFQVPSGDYTLKAEYYENNILDSNIEENITITDEGDYIIDLILFPYIDIDDNFEPFEEENKPNYLIYLIIILVLIIAFFILIKLYKKKNRKKETKIEQNDEDESTKVLEFIKKEDGRTTQRDIRKALGLSEAKASLIITELEHKNILKRIKKGRGNVIILNK